MQDENSTGDDLSGEVLAEAISELILPRLDELQRLASGSAAKLEEIQEVLDEAAEDLAVMRREIEEYDAILARESFRVLSGGKTS